MEQLKWLEFVGALVREPHGLLRTYKKAVVRPLHTKTRVWRLQDGRYNASRMGDMSKFGEIYS